MINILTSSTAKLAKVLEQEGCCTRGQFKEIETQAKRENKPVAAVLLEHANGGVEKTLEVLGQYYELEPVNLRGRVISPYVLNMLPKEVAEAHHVVIFKKTGDLISVAMVDPEDKQVINFIQRKTKLEPVIFITTPADIAYALQRYEGELSEEFSKIIEESLKETLASHEPMEKLAQFVPVVKMVNSIIDRALSRRASDIHLEPGSEQLLVRFRIDGLLRRVVELPREVLPPILARIKLMSNLKIDEHRLPQDGRFRYTFNDREVALRVSIVPNLYGSKVVLRLLDAKEKSFDFKALGLNKRDLTILKHEAAKPHGMMVVTGPTGSGKTTTLYTMMRLLNRERVNICTIEDPIEYGLDGVNQMQVNPSAGLTFAHGLRSMLRQDPDIVMVGEIRDPETAEIALNAAMTGHLVLSTLHTNDAFLASQRLVEMGMHPFLISSVVNVFIGQRLVRTICRNCSTQITSTEKHLERYAKMIDLDSVVSKLQQVSLLPKDFSWNNVKLYAGRGCDKCNNTGYQGRLGIYEFVVMDADVRQAILTSPNASAIKKATAKQCTTTMEEDGILKVINGQTTLEEVARVTQE